jgi:hypothetical protein
MIKARTAGSGVVADVFWVIHGIEKLTATALASIAMLEKTPAEITSPA